MLGDARITCLKQRTPSLLKLTYSQSEVLEIDFKNTVKLFFVFLRLKGFGHIAKTSLENLCYKAKINSENYSCYLVITLIFSAKNKNRFISLEQSFLDVGFKQTPKKESRK
ncbi:hypothetical protein M0802_016628 [Mischocyttarus mexicanus]|nr:hypothetical protein M0802_016628 [Mischocyttarus mexicanus]